MCSSSRAEVPQVATVGFGTEMSEKRISGEETDERARPGRFALSRQQSGGIFRKVGNDDAGAGAAHAK